MQVSPGEQLAMIFGAQGVDFGGVLRNRESPRMGGSGFLVAGRLGEGLGVAGGVDTPTNSMIQIGLPLLAVVCLQYAMPEMRLPG